MKRKLIILLFLSAPFTGNALRLADKPTPALHSIFDKERAAANAHGTNKIMMWLPIHTNEPFNYDTNSPHKPGIGNGLIITGGTIMLMGTALIITGGTSNETGGLNTGINSLVVTCGLALFVLGACFLVPGLLKHSKYTKSKTEL
jgi:hypothetical protein